MKKIVKNVCITNDKIIKDILNNIIKNNFNSNYDHRWLNYIYKYTDISNDDNCHIYFKSFFVTTIIENNLYNENFLSDLINCVIETIKKYSIKLEIYHLPDILKTNKKYKLLFDKQCCENELNSFRNNNEVYYKYVSKKILMIDFCIKNNKIIFYIKHTKFFECNISEIDKILTNNKLISLYRSLETQKTKIYYMVDYNNYYNEKWISYMFLKGFWVDFCNQSGDDHDYQDICFQNMTYYITYYDIIIYNIPTSNHIFNMLEKINIIDYYYKINTLKHKMFIILNEKTNFDLHNIDWVNNEKKILPKHINKFIYHSYPNLYDDNVINNVGKRNYKAKSIYPDFRICNSRDLIFKICEPCKLGLLKFSFNNYNILSREEFFKIYNIDLNKKLVTLYLTFQSHLDLLNSLKKAYNIQNNQHKKNLLIQMKKLEDVKIKIKSKHSEINKIKNEQMKSKLKKELEDLLGIENNRYKEVKQLRNILDDKDIRTNFENDIIVNKNKFILDLLKSFENQNCNVVIKLHPNSGINLINSEYTTKYKKKKYILNFINCINKEFKIIDSSFKNELYKYSDFCIFLSATSMGYYNYLYNTPALCISSKNPYYNWFRSIDYLKKYYYGHFAYYEEMKEDDLDIIVKHFLNEKHKNNYKYFKNHPLYGNDYTSNYESFGNEIIKLINSNKNLKNTHNSIKLLIEPKYVVTYDKENIKVDLISDEIIINIINTPNTNYGFSIKSFSNKNITGKIKLVFECKLYEHEENINLRIYTGEKWLEVEEKLTSYYKNYIIEDEFAIKWCKSRWRINATSKKRGQKIYFKNITFL
mgnify:CR=1 FL=1|tara:strand:+ start:3261 stop:5705 length:2445 start_codon:yes stop_codon:yes gene_type:complete